LITGRSQSAGRPRSRLGTPVDVEGLLAKNEHRAKFLDELDHRSQQEEDSGLIDGGNSDSLDDLLQKFVELERPSAGPLAAVKGGYSEMSISLAGDSEWI